MFVSSRSRETVLLGVGNCLVSFVGGSTKLFNLGVVVYSIFKVDVSDSVNRDISTVGGRASLYN